MAEDQNLRDEFKGWSLPARDEKLRSLARVIRHFRPMSFEFSVSRADYYRLVTPVAPRGTGNPHFICCFAVVAGVARHIGQTVSLPIDFIFDQQDGVDSDISLFFSEMKKSLPRSAQQVIAGTPIFRDDKDHRFLPLQAADMLAWHLRREHEVCLPPPARLPMAELLRAEAGHIMSAIDEAMMLRWSNHHVQFPALAQVRGKSQWQRAKREMARMLELGYVPPYGSHWRNAVHRVREYIHRLLGR
jgi:hypothetical protein